MVGTDDERPPGGVGQSRQGGGGRTGFGVFVVIAEHRLQQRHRPAAPGVDGRVGDAAGARGPQGTVLELGDGGLVQPGRVPRPVQVLNAYGDDPVAGGAQACTFVGVVGEAVVRATGVVAAAVGEDGDGTAAAGAQAPGRFMLAAWIALPLRPGAKSRSACTTSDKKGLDESVLQAARGSAISASRAAVAVGPPWGPT